MSSFRPSTAVTGGIKTTEPVDEPVREYRPGSPEAVSLEAEIARVGARSANCRTWSTASGCHSPMKSLEPRLVEEIGQIKLGDPTEQ